MLVLFLVSSGMVFGQAVLTFHNNAPRQGTVSLRNFVETDGLDPGSAGPDQLWDFSGTTLSTTDQSMVVDPASTPWGSHYPGANICAKDEEEQYVYGMITESSYENIGIVFQSILGPVRIFYTDPIHIISWPFTYGSVQEDDYAGHYSLAAGNITYQTGHVVVEGDAWGTLRLPGVTLYNVLRIKATHEIVDSALISGSPPVVRHTRLTQYAWYGSFTKNPVLNYTIKEIEDDTEVTVWYAVNEVSTGQVEKAPGYSIFPSPATDQFCFHAEFGGDELVMLRIIDCLGQTVYEHSIRVPVDGIIEHKIPCNAWKKGIYYVIVAGNEKKISGPLMVH